MPVKAPPAPTYSWEGFYVGGNVGWLGIEGVSLSGTPADSATATLLGPCSAAGACPTSIGSAQGNSVSGGGQFGFNWQVQSWVIGLEADAQAAGAKASSSANVNVPAFGPYFASQSIKETGFGTIRGRAGLVGDTEPSRLRDRRLCLGCDEPERGRRFPVALRNRQRRSGVHGRGWDRRCRPRMGFGKPLERGRRISLRSAGGHQSHPPDRSSRGRLHSRLAFRHVSSTFPNRASPTISYV